MRKIVFTAVFVISAAIILTSCTKSGNGNSSSSKVTSSGEKAATDISLESMDFTFSDRDRDSSYDESSATVISNNQDIIEIKNEGTYIISDSHRMINVTAAETAKIQIVLKNATISNSDGPAILIKSADKVFITVPEESKSIISDGSTYSSDYNDTNIDGAVFSKSDLTLNGGGTLTVNGSYKCGIVSKDDLVIYGINLEVTSVGTALEGKDCIKSAEAVITANAESDGIKSTNTEDVSRGYVYIESGNYSITAGNDGIQAETAVKINSGEVEIKTGGGSENASTTSDKWGMWGSSTKTQSEASAKGIKASRLILIDGGNISIHSSDDSIHSNSDAEINGGSIKLSSGDDGIHADDQLAINGGSIKAEKSYEGLEGTVIIISGGEIDITSSDDGLNAAGGNDSSALGGRPGANTFNSNSDAVIEIRGGYILIDASGDGVDSNGSIKMTGGVLLVSGPSNNGNGGLDYESEALISGGTAIICGSSGMAQGFSENSDQGSFMYTLNNSIEAGSYMTVSENDGKVIASFLPSNQYTNVVVSSPKLEIGKNYILAIGGSVSKCDKNGFTEDGVIYGAEEKYEIEMSSNYVAYGTNSGMSGGMNGKPGGGMGGERPVGPGGRQ